MEDLGLPREELRRIVLTHFHEDHAGSAAELADWAGATVIAGEDDVAFVRGAAPVPRITFTRSERHLHATIAADLTPAPACEMVQEVTDQDVLQMGSAAR